MQSRSEDSETRELGPSEAHVEVLRAGPSGYVLEATFEDIPLTEFAAAGVGPGLSGQEFQELAESLVLRYAAGKNGVFRRVLNEDQLRDLTNETLDLLGERYGGDPELQVAVEQLRPLVTSSNFLQNILPQDIALLHSIYEVDLNGRKTLSSPSLVPSPFGGPPLPARATTRLIAGDDSSCREVEIATIIDPDRLRETLEANLGRFDVDGEPVRLPPASFESSQRFTYDPGRGMVVRVVGTKDIEVGARQRIDKIEVSVTEFEGG